MTEIYRMREMVPADLDEVMVIEEKSFTTPWNRRMYERELGENPFATCQVMLADTRVVGYIDYWRVHEEGHIMTVAVAAGNRRQGLGEKLIRQALAVLERHRVKRVLLEVRPSNNAARTLYDKLGFYQLGVRPRYYSDTGEDALVMQYEVDK